MPKYDLKTTVVDGKGGRLTGEGVDLPKAVGDKLVALGKATECESKTARPASKAKAKDAPGDE